MLYDVSARWSHFRSFFSLLRARNISFSSSIVSNISRFYFRWTDERTHNRILHIDMPHLYWNNSIMERRTVVTTTEKLLRVSLSFTILNFPSNCRCVWGIWILFLSSTLLLYVYNSYLHSAVSSVAANTIFIWSKQKVCRFLFKRDRKLVWERNCVFLSRVKIVLLLFDSPLLSAVRDIAAQHNKLEKMKSSKMKEKFVIVGTYALINSINVFPRWNFVF